MTRLATFLRTLPFLPVLALLLAASFTITACDSGGEPEPPVVNEPEPVVVPVLTMSSVEVPINGGGFGLQFFVRGDQDLSYRKVTIVPPPPFDDIVFNLGDTFVIAEESVALQNDNTAYTKVNGTWEFTFDVTSGSGQDTQGHTVKRTLDIGGSQSSTLTKDAPFIRPLR